MSKNSTTGFHESSAMPQRVRDVLGRLKVSIHQNVYEADFEYGPQALRWETLVQSFDGNTNIQAIPNSGGVRMRVGTTLGDISIRQSRPYHRYQPGKTMFMATGCMLGTALAGNVQRVGFFDDNNGVFFEQSVATANNPFGMYAVVRTDVGGVVQETRTGLDLWSGDPNLVRQIDFAKIQMFWIEYGWYGAGATRWGFWLNGEPFIAHQIGWGNYANPLTGGAQTTPWARTGNLPVRYEQRNTAGTTQINDMYHYGVSVIVEGQRDEQRGFTYSYGLPNTVQTRAVTPGTSRYPLLTVRGRPMGTQEYGTAVASTNTTLGALSTITSVVVSSSTFVAQAMTTNTNYVMTVTSVTSGTITVGQQLQGTGLPWMTYVVSQLTSSAAPATTATNTATFTSGANSITVSSSSSIAVGQLISGTGIYPGTFVGSIAGTVIGLVDKYSQTSSTSAANASTGSTYGFYTAGGTGTYQISSAPTIFGVTTASTTVMSPSGFNYGTVTNVLGTGTVIGYSQQITIPAANFTPNQYQGRAIYFPSLISPQIGGIGKIVAHSTNTLYVADQVSGLQMLAVPTTGTVSTTSITGGGAGQYQFTVGATTNLTTGTAVYGVGVSTGSVITSINGTTVTVNLPMTAAASGNGFFQQGYQIGLINRGQLLPKRLMVSSDNRCVVEMISNSIVNTIQYQGQQPNFTPLNQLGSNYSFAERDYISTSTVNNSGEVVFAFTLAAGSGLQDIDFGYFFPLYTSIRGNQIDSLTLAITTVPGTTATVGGHLICQEAMS
jgi:hypothetical protein